MPSADTREWGAPSVSPTIWYQRQARGTTERHEPAEQRPRGGWLQPGAGTQRKHRVQGLLGVSSVIVGDDEALAAPGAARQAPADTHPHLCPQSPHLHLDLFYS